MNKKVVEAEIIQEPSGFNYKQRYKQYTTVTQQSSSFVWVVNVLALLCSFIPVIGFVFALFALIVTMLKKIPPILPLLALFISGFVSMLFIVIFWVIKLLFS